MKKFLPFLFPLIALVIVLVLIFRWYNSQTAKPGKISDFADGTQIDQLSASDSTRLRQSAKDTNTVEMQGGQGVMGEIRYEIKNGKVMFSVIANVPENKTGVYQVWLQAVNGSAKKKAFILELDKGGYIGSGSISADTLPFEVVVSLEKNQDNEQETPLLRGVIQKESAAQSN